MYLLVWIILLNLMMSWRLFNGGENYIVIFRVILFNWSLIYWVLVLFLLVCCKMYMFKIIKY